MAFRLFGAKPLSKPMPGYCHLDLCEQTYKIIIKIKKLFSQANPYENIVCEMTAILYMGR